MAKTGYPERYGLEFVAAGFTPAAVKSKGKTSAVPIKGTATSARQNKDTKSKKTWFRFRSRRLYACGSQKPQTKVCVYEDR